jgi:DNA-binding transcriptional MerR regulator
VSLCIKTGAQIRTYDAEDVLELLNCRDQEVALENISEIRKKIDPEEADEPEPKHNEMTVKFTEGLGNIAAGTMLFDDTDWNEEVAATSTQARHFIVKRMHTNYKFLRLLK